MPSVRVRKTPSDYDLLGDRFDNDVEVSSHTVAVRGQRSMGSIPRGSAHQAQMNAAPLVPRMRSRTTSGASFSSPVPASFSRSPIHRARSGSKIAEHVLASHRPSISPPPLSCHVPPAVDSHGTISDRTLRMQGSQTGISMDTQSDN